MPLPQLVTIGLFRSAPLFKKISFISLGDLKVLSSLKSVLKGTLKLLGIRPDFKVVRGSGSVPRKRPFDLASITCSFLLVTFLINCSTVLVAFSSLEAI